jgi:hypothetical protein
MDLACRGCGRTPRNDGVAIVMGPVGVELCGDCINAMKFAYDQARPTGPGVIRGEAGSMVIDMAGTVVAEASTVDATGGKVIATGGGGEG